MTHLASRLQGRTAIVTGAGGGIGGIGRGVALALAAEGANVVIAARRVSNGEQTAALISAEGGAALVVRCDVSKRQDIETTVSTAVSKFGCLDIIVHNAVDREGGVALALEEITDENWRTQASVAWDGAYLLAVTALPHLKRSIRGSFIVFGSVSGLHGAGVNPVYSALKGGSRGFVKALAREWAPHNITVNAIDPAAASDPAQLLSNMEPGSVKRLLSSLPMGRLGRPREDIGRVVAAICSDDFGFVTAQSIQVDGGLYTAL